MGGKNGKTYNDRGDGERFKVSKETVRRRLKDNVWPFYIIGDRSLRLDIDEVKALLKRERKESSAN